MQVRSLAVALTVTLAACRRAPAPGGDCDPTPSPPSICADRSTALRCESSPGRAGSYRPYPCRGSKGCWSGGCDTSLAEHGDACRADEGGGQPLEACAVDRASKLRCVDGRFVEVDRCRGEAGCDPATLRCDSSVGAVGDSCRSEGQALCSTDGKRVLRGRDGKESKGEWCRGPRGCETLPDAGGFSCDQRIGAAAEGCSSIGDSCSATGAAVLRCERGRFVVREECGAKKCVSLETTGDILRAECR